jgi:hypothetical protein
MPSQRPNLVSIARVPNNPAQFVYTVDKASTLLTPGDFLLWRNAGTLAPYAATTVSAISGTQFLATFGAAPAGDAVLTTSNTASVVWGAIDWTLPIAATPPPPAGGFPAIPGHAAMKTSSAIGAANAVGGVAVATSSTALANGPILQTVSLSVGSGQGVFTFDRPIAVGSVAPGRFYVVFNNGTVTAGVGVVAVSNNQVTIQFPAAGTGFVTANAIGGGLVGPFELQPPIAVAPAAPIAATDSAGNPAVGTSVASSLVP